VRAGPWLPGWPLEPGRALLQIEPRREPGRAEATTTPASSARLPRSPNSRPPNGAPGVGCVNLLTLLVGTRGSAVEQVVWVDRGRVRARINSDAVAAVRGGELERAMGPVLVVMLGVARRTRSRCRRRRMIVAPGRRFDPPARFLPGRVRLQVQPAHLPEPRSALLPTDGAGGSDDAEAREGHHRRAALARDDLARP
jgi:hypothetical protein